MTEQKRFARMAVVELYRSRWQLNSFRKRVILALAETPEKTKTKEKNNGKKLGNQIK